MNGDAPNFDLRSLGPAQIAELGRHLRRQSTSRTTAEIGASIAHLLYDSLRRNHGMHGTALVRCYLTQSARGLMLIGAAGREPSWDDRSVPLVAHLLQELTASGRASGSFYVADALGSPYLPEQEQFVRPYNIRSAFAFGGVLPDGEVFAVVALTLAAIDETTARAFEALGLHLRLALLQASDLLERDPIALMRSRTNALEELLEHQESLLIRSDQRVNLEHLAEARRRELEENNSKLVRTQRAMLNVIEDLREARTDLERRIAERTRELVRVNESLRTSNRELEEFAYVASHDLQEPLRTVVGYLQLIEQRYGDQLDRDAEEFIELAMSGARRMQALIDGLLSYSRVATQGRSHSQTSLDAILDQVLASLSAALADSRAEIQRSPLPTVSADALQMQQLLQNLLSNSIKFAGDQPPMIRIWAEDAGKFWRISVRDSGLGFDPKFSERVFRVFRRLRRDTPGTGIGLAICKKIVERHGGKIEAEAEPGAGATFSFTLPRTEDS